MAQIRDSITEVGEFVQAEMGIWHIKSTVRENSREGALIQEGLDGIRWLWGE